MTGSGHRTYRLRMRYMYICHNAKTQKPKSCIRPASLQRCTKWRLRARARQDFDPRFAGQTEAMRIRASKPRRSHAWIRGIRCSSVIAAISCRHRHRLAAFPTAAIRWQQSVCRNTGACSSMDPAILRTTVDKSNCKTFIFGVVSDYRTTRPAAASHRVSTKATRFIATGQLQIVYRLLIDTEHRGGRAILWRHIRKSSRDHRVSAAALRRNSDMHQRPWTYAKIQSVPIRCPSR